MAEEVKNDDQQKKLSQWADPLVSGTFIAGVMSLTAARVNFPIAAVICCGFGGIALGRCILEKKWLYAGLSVAIMAGVAFGALKARVDMDKQVNRSVRQMQQAFGE